MIARKSNRFQRRAPDFSVGTYLVFATQGFSGLLRVEKHEGNKAEARVLRSGGTFSLNIKPSTATRAVLTRDEAMLVFETLKLRPKAAPDREERMKWGLKAQRSLDPFLKADVLAMLALVREGGIEFWSDDKVLYNRLKQQLADELIVSLGITEEEVQTRLAAVGII